MDNKNTGNNSEKPKERPIKIIIKRLIRLEELAKENKVISASIFIIVAIVGSIGFLADITSLFDDNKVTAVVEEKETSVDELEKSDFIPEFFLYEEYDGRRTASVELNATKKAYNLYSVKYAASCDGKNFIETGWYPVDVKGDCLDTSDDFYLKVISREGEESDTFHYKLDFPEAIRKHKMKEINEEGVDGFVDYTKANNSEYSYIHIGTHLDELVELIDKIYLGKTRDELGTVIKYNNNNDQEIIEDNDLSLIQDEREKSFYKMPGALDSIFAQLEFNDGGTSKIKEILPE